MVQIYRKLDWNQCNKTVNDDVYDAFQQEIFVSVVIILGQLLVYCNPWHKHTCLPTSADTLRLAFCNGCIRQSLISRGNFWDLRVVLYTEIYSIYIWNTILINSFSSFFFIFMCYFLALSKYFLYINSSCHYSVMKIFSLVIKQYHLSDKLYILL